MKVGFCNLHPTTVKLQNKQSPKPRTLDHQARKRGIGALENRMGFGGKHDYVETQIESGMTGVVKYFGPYDMPPALGPSHCGHCKQIAIHPGGLGPEGLRASLQGLLLREQGLGVDYSMNI